MDRLLPVAHALPAAGEVKVERGQAAHDPVESALRVLPSGAHAQVILCREFAQALALEDVVLVNAVQLARRVVADAVHLEVEVTIENC